MTRLAELALTYVPRERAIRVLDAAVGAGEHLVFVAEEFLGESRYAELSDVDRAHAVLARLRGADRRDRGASAALAAWAEANGASADGVVAFGEPLAFDHEPIQEELFDDVLVQRPPATFAEGPFDLVLADVPRRDLTADERARLRLRFDAVAGHFPGEVPYIERLLGLVTDDGAIALRMRSAILRREFGRALVDELGRRTRLLAAEIDGDHVIAVFRLSEVGDGAALLRTLGSEPAARVLRAMQAGAQGNLSEHLHGAIGPTSNPGCDDVWEVPRWLESRLPTIGIVRAADVVNWAVRPSTRIVWPYDEHGQRRTPPDEGVIAWLSRFRALLERREVFGRPIAERDVHWYEYVEHHPDRWGAVPAVVIARSGTQPRVGVLREPAVVAPNALLLRPDEHVDPCFIAGVLASSLAAFWMKHVFHVYRTDAGQVFELTASGVEHFPIPAPSEAVTAAAAGIERVARSLRPLRSAIDGDPERLGARLDGVREANARVRDDLERLHGELDEAVFGAYGLADEAAVRAAIDSDEYRRVVEVPPDDHESEVLMDWLIDAVSDAFANHELPTSRPVAADEIADWLRRQPLARAVLARLGLSVVDVLMYGAVPAEPDYCFSASGVETLRAWAEGRPRAFRLEDYASRGVEMPPTSATRLRRQIWRWRGRYNVPRERFVLLVGLSRARDRAYFGWGGASERDRRRLFDALGEDAGAQQIDLERLIELQQMLSGEGATEAELADALYTKGWGTRDVSFALSVLERSGHVTQARGRWRLR